ncbi:hypothetical protein AVEN_23069-1 [Araneus ventricosus]|uniref:Uncharacterized protein n=1 Tax=Araneus ventricosus TaxID=182803 RepID=A0A4Y2IN43_ARAVE|nr:hypothetical protein AVEN_23069-1 [Araneus ventricosus]
MYDKISTVADEISGPVPNFENIRNGSDVTACDVGKRAFWLEEEVRRGLLGVLDFIEGGERVFWFLASREMVSGCPVDFFGLVRELNYSPGRGSHDGWNDEAYIFSVMSALC